MEEMSVFATLLSAHRLSIDRVYHIVRGIGEKRYCAGTEV